MDGTVSYRNRLIGFLDILGFSERLKTSNPSDLHRMYAAFIDKANTKIFESASIPGSKDPYVTNFALSRFLFDSILLVSHETPDSLGPSKFVFALQALMEMAYTAQMPLRGAVTYGEILVDYERGIFICPNFPDLVSQEKEQEWSGCLIDRLAEKHVVEGIFGNAPPQPSTAVQSNPIIEYEVPFKSSGVANQRRLYWCLNWVQLLDVKEMASGEAFLSGAKRRNTLLFVDHFRALIDDSQSVSQDFAPASRMKLAKGRRQFRVRFLDDAGNGVVPRDKDVKIAIIDPSTSKPIAHFTIKYPK